MHARMCYGVNAFSASSFHIVTSQVLKNLELLNSFGSVARDRTSKWNAKWRWSQTARIGLPRIRRAPSRLNGGSKLFSYIDELLTDSLTEKEVWVVLRQGFSIAGMNQELNKSRPKYNVAQLAYLLHSCNHSVSSVGAKLRVLSCQ